MKKTHACVLHCTILATVLAYGAQVQAQAMDYGTLQSVFGEPVTTSATGTPQRVSDVPANMTIITADEIRQSGSRSIPEILSRVPGLDILRTSETAFDVGVRGYNQPLQPRLQVLVDGRQVFIDDYSRTDWFNIPVNVDDIRQIEVVKGPNSALFGSNAAGGVINIITYNPLYDHNNVAGLTYGSQNTITGDATATTHPSDSNGIKVTAGGLTADEFGSSRPAQESINTVNPIHRYATESSLYQASPKLQLNTELTYSESVDNEGDQIFNLMTDKTTTYSVRGGIAWQTDYGLIKNDNYWNHTGFDYTSPGVPPADVITNLYVSKLEDLFKIGADNAFHTALEYRFKTFNFNPSVVAPGNAQSPQFDLGDLSVSASWLKQINNKLSWTNAVRLDHTNLEQTGQISPNSVVTDADYSHDLNAYSINSGLVYEATDKDSFRATYGRGVELPSMLEYGFTKVVDVGAPFLLQFDGNPNLKPTIVTNYELGYDRKIPEILSTAKFSIYYELNQDLKGPDQTTSMPTIAGTQYAVVQSINVGSSQGWGGELELEGNSPGGFRWDASYSLAMVSDSSLAASNLGYAGSTPEQHFRLLAGYTKGPWEFDVNGQYLTSSFMFRDNGNGTPAQYPTNAYSSLDARIGYTVNDHITLALSGTDLAQASTDESPYPPIERQVFLSLTGRF